jgi:trehalose-6-phosphate synthase
MSWRTDLEGRARSLNDSIFINPQKDDEEVQKAKKEAIENMKQQVWVRFNDPKLMQNKNQRIIANQFAEFEEKLSLIGRKLFGIKWNTTPCGAGFVQTSCGRIAPCGPT